jgi:hypothetical protein
MMRMNPSAAAALILSALMFAYSQVPQSGPQTRQAQAEVVQEKPLKPKKVLIKELPEGVEGLKLEKGVFKLQPGYKFVPQPNKSVGIALKAGGGSVTGTFDCFCAKEGGGSCSATTVGGTISCGKSKTSPCSDECVLRTTIGGNLTRLAIY